MSRLNIVLGKDLKETLKTPSAYIGLAIAASFVGQMAGRAVKDARELAVEGLEQLAQLNAGQSLIDSTLLSTCLMATIGLCILVSNITVVLEKRQRNLESLLCTPVSLREVWLAKTLAITLPCTCCGILLGGAMTAVLVRWPVAQALGVTLWPSLVMMLIVLLGIPALIFLAFDMFTGLQFALRNPRVLNVLMIFALIIISGVLYAVRVAESSMVQLAILGTLIMLLAGADWIVSRVVTVERVLLTSRD